MNSSKFNLLKIGKSGDPDARITLSQPEVVDTLDERTRAAKSSPDAQGTVAFGDVIVGGRPYTVANTFENVSVSIWSGPAGPEEPATTFETRALAFESPEEPGVFHNFLMVPQTELEAAKAGTSGGGAESFGTASMMTTSGTGGEDEGVITPLAVINGTAGNDSLDGTVDPDTIDGLGGDDTINGFGGNDSLIGGSGNDSIFGGDGNDTIDGGLNNDTLMGDDGNDVIDGRTGSDSILGGLGNDTLSGGFGNDTIEGGDGDDSIVVVTDNFGTDIVDGGNQVGRDALNFSVTSQGITLDFSQGTASDPTDGVITSGVNTITFSGIERFALSTGDDIVIGSTGNDTVQTLFDGNDSADGGLGDDAFAGGLGNDTLNGGSGADTLIGDLGDDLLDAGVDGDRDVVVFRDGESNDTILNFDLSESTDGNSVDRLNVSNVTDLDGDPINSFDDVVVTDDGSGNAVLTFPRGDSITLFNVAPTEVDEANELNDLGIVCFTPGILITTEQGNLPVEDLRVGDRVLTVDSGFQTIRWVGHRTLNRAELAANPHLRPIIVRKHAFGNVRKMRVSPQHGLYLKSDDGGRLIRAKHAAEFLGGKYARVDRHCEEVTYIHVMFDAHQLIFAEGAPSEAFYPGPMALRALARDCMMELLTIFPELGEVVILGKPVPAYGTSARPYLRGRDVKAMERGQGK